VAWVAPVALAVAFAAAGGAKLADRPATVEGFRALGVPAPALLAVAIPVAEVLAAVLLVAAPAVGAAVAVVLLVAFTGLLAVRVAQGSTAACRCFGGVRVRPVSWRDLARNTALLALAVVVLVASPT